MGGTSRISREAYVRICGRLGVKFPGATRRSAGDRRPYAECAEHVRQLEGESPFQQPDGGEVIARRKGVVARRGLKEASSKRTSR
jgi:hypothetical protein